MMATLRAWLGAITLTIVIVAFAYFAIATAQQNVLLAKQAEASQRTEQALCILRADLEQRVESSQLFLKNNPNGIPGLSAEAIQQSIDAQQRTVVALQLLHCEGP